MTDRARNRPRNRPSRFWAAAVGMLLTGAFAVVGTSALPTPWFGGVGAPETTTPVEARAAADQPLVRIAALGDVGTGEPDQYAVAAKLADLAQHDPLDALILLGDNVYPDGAPNRLDATVFRPFEPVLAGGADLLPVLGNHDADYAAEQVATLGMPGRWYAHEVGDVLFVGLDSTDPENPAQLRWLDDTLASSSAPWIVAAMHHPPFSAGMHGSDEDVRDEFVPLFERYGVDLVLSGHDHDYQRSFPIGGITYVVSGGGAKVRPTGSSDFTAYSAATLHFVEVAVWADRMELTAVGLDGAFDRTVLQPVAPSAASAVQYPENEGREEAPAGTLLAGAGGILWLAVLATRWFLPEIAVGRSERLFIAASTAGMLAVLAGLTFVGVGLVV